MPNGAYILDKIDTQLDIFEIHYPIYLKMVNDLISNMFQKSQLETIKLPEILVFLLYFLKGLKIARLWPAKNGF